MGSGDLAGNRLPAHGTTVNTQLVLYRCTHTRMHTHTHAHTHTYNWWRQEGLKNRGLNRFEDIGKKSSFGISLAKTFANICNVIIEGAHRSVRRCGFALSCLVRGPLLLWLLNASRDKFLVTSENRNVSTYTYMVFHNNRILLLNECLFVGFNWRFDWFIDYTRGFRFQG